ncbi:MAG: NUDIX domain-containing protein [bacterium]|nr:NUDIX domain-containing protein [bacterium]
MPEIKVAIVVFYDKEGNVFVQERGKDVSKTGEKYGFWGGRIEKRETPKQALKRELKEELEFVPKKLDFFGIFSYKLIPLKRKTVCSLGQKAKCWIFLSPVNRDLSKVKIKEGKGMLKMKIDKVIKGKGFPIGSVEFVKKVKKQLYGKD